MAKVLTFSLGGKEFVTNPEKVDRKKLYGWTEKLALDEDGIECSLVSMDESGTLIIPRGGIGLGILDDDGKWVERSSLKTVGLDGSPLELTPSSYSVVNTLEEKATREELLACAVKLVYQLAAEPELVSEIGQDIYKFEYCYRDSFETSTAFLLVSGENLFMLSGVMSDFEYIGLEEISIATEDEAAEEDDDSDEIDFSMF